MHEGTSAVEPFVAGTPREIPEQLEPHATIPVTPALEGPRTGNTPRSSRQLLYLHDLKLVHPDEIYADREQLLAPPGGVPADRSGPGQDPQSLDSRAVPYVDFMDDLLGSFSRGDHRTALADLRELLSQHPDDVNGLFYAGLCCYNLGMFDRAAYFFDRAAHHPINTFDEEAAWFHALSVDQRGEPGDATELFRSIADQGGFYAERAKARLSQ
jgi:tetratricopeptide (TPR) repeat protein